MLTGLQADDCREEQKSAPPLEELWLGGWEKRRGEQDGLAGRGLDGTLTTRQGSLPDLSLPQHLNVQTVHDFAFRVPTWCLFEPHLSWAASQADHDGWDSPGGRPAPVSGRAPPPSSPQGSNRAFTWWPSQGRPANQLCLPSKVVSWIRGVFFSVLGMGPAVYTHRS